MGCRGYSVVRLGSLDPKEEAIRALYAARRDREHARVRPLLDDDVVWHEPGDEDYSGDYRGADEVLSLLDRLLEVTEGTFVLEPVEYLSTADHVAVKISWAAERDGRRVQGEELAVYRFRGGKVAEVWFHPDGFDPAALRDVFSSS
jgi:uncharacterized protein